MTEFPKDTGAAAGKAMCHTCGGTLPIEDVICRGCGNPLHLRKQNAIQKTLALVLTGAALLIPANILPIMTTTSLGQENTNTILGGVALLWEHGDYLLALVILVTSLLVPVTKLLALIWLCYKGHVGNT